MFGQSNSDSLPAYIKPNNQNITVTPTVTQQVFTADQDHTGLGTVTVNAVTSSIDNNITSGNIIDGVTILGVTGNATVLNGDTLSVTPSTSAQILTPTSPKNGFTQVSVSAVTSTIDQNITAENIKNGVTILGVTGNYTGGGGSLPTGLAIFDIPHGSFNIECDNLDWGSWAQQNIYRISILVDITQQIVVGIMLYNNVNDILSFGYDGEPYYLNIVDSTYENLATYDIRLGFYDYDMGDISTLAILPGPLG